MFVITYILCAAALFWITNAQTAVPQGLMDRLVCIDHEDCGACLAAAAHCRWCADPYYDETKQPRCNDDASLVEAGCSQSLIERPKAPVWELLQNRSLQDMSVGSEEESVVQIQPQKIRLSLKPRETRKIRFQYRPAKNYPLDLYYLMDLTWSMKDDKETLVSLQDDLPDLLKKLTDNFRLGFGSFADKPVMPYTSMDVKRRANPCTVEEGSCESTYSFRHHLSLTNQVDEFIKKVNSSSVTANLDNAEAQLDALVQAITCGDRIGWKATSRKIIILLSDGSLHTAGDGLLGGAIKRNDLQCHLDENGYHSSAGIYDYPSISQVYRLLDKYKVNVIFAVTESVKQIYDSIHQLLEDFTYVARLESDSSNILKLVKTGYDDIVSVVDFTDDSESGPIKVKYFTDCGVKGGSLIETTRCTGVEYGMTLNYEAHVTLDGCPAIKQANQTIHISESQLGQDSLTLEVDIQCSCDCENNVGDNPTHVNCPLNSLSVCGVCQCKKGWSGPKCDCSMKDEEASAALMAQCWEPNSTKTACSGAGDCICGDCQCDRGYSGKYCQCKDCEKSIENGLPCGGVGRGVCVCGTCACAAGFSGVACDCVERDDLCVAPAGKEVCSGHGECACGRCQCSEISEGGPRYTGMFCETCATCENPLCANAEPCVECYLSRNCTDLCTILDINYKVIERLNDTDLTKPTDITCVLRRVEDDQDCEYRYTYSYNSSQAMEIVVRSRECGTTTSAMTSFLVTLICVLLGGMVGIMIFKSAQIVSDRRAYAKFLQEAEESKLGVQQMNPLYISPISEFRMPDSFPRDRHD